MVRFMGKLVMMHDVLIHATMDKLETKSNSIFSVGHLKIKERYHKISSVFNICNHFNGNHISLVVLCETVHFIRHRQKKKQ